MVRFSLGRRWRHLSGHLYGLPQPAFVGQVRVTGAGTDDGARLDAALAMTWPDVSPGHAPAEPDVHLVSRLLFWTGELQRQARVAVCLPAHLATRSSPQGRVHQVVLGATLTEPARLALETVASAFNDWFAAADPAPAQALLGARLQRLVELLRSHAEPGFNQIHLLQAAWRRGVPVHRVTRSLTRLGTGARSRLLDSTFTDQTTVVGTQIAQDKALCAQVLAEAGLPVPRHQLVDSADAAAAAADRLGWPVVVKPSDQDQGRGVAAHLGSEPEVRQAYAEARAVSTRVLVERHVHGFGYRLTILEGDLLAVLRRVPGGVTGDGTHTVAELLQRQLQSEEVRRRIQYGRVALDAEALALLSQQGLTPASVPERGRFVLMRRRDNISAGGRLEHLDPAVVHPDNLQAARRAARAARLDLAGVDFLSADISRSWRENGAVICEINAKPQFGGGLDGANHERLLARLLPGKGRIPVRLLLAPADHDAEVEACVETLCREHDLAAVSRGSGVWLRQERLSGPWPQGWRAAQSALADRDVPSLLMLLTPGEVVAQGLPVDRIDAVHVVPETCQGWSPTELQAIAAARVCCGLTTARAT